MNEQQLIEQITGMIQADELPDFTPSFTGALLLETLVAEWEALSVLGRGNLTLVLATLAKGLSAEARAEKTTAQILRKLTGQA